jgi:hypothetical protein
MKKIYSAVILLCLISILTNAQSPTSVFASSDCNSVRNFDLSDEGFSSPSIYSDDENVSFYWHASAGALIDSSGLPLREGSLISPLFINNMGGQTVVGFTYSAPAGTQYRIRVISGTIGAPLELLATTANGPLWTPLPSTSGTMCLLLVDADLTPGQGLRYEFTFRAVLPDNILFDNFSINSANAQLPVTFLGFIAKKNDNGTTKLLWNVGDEISVNNYVVERSMNGTVFTTVGSVNAEGKADYTLEDNQVINDTRYYRVKNVDIDGKSKYTPVIKVSGKERSTGQIQIYPVPAQDIVYVQHDKAPMKATITIHSLDGRLVRQVQAISNSYQTSINVNGLTAGIYLVRYDDGNGDVQSAKLIKN